MISAAQLYDHIACPKRVDLDLHGDPAGRVEISPFVRMLWERGSSHESEVLSRLPGTTVSLAELAPDERELRTLAAMAEGAALIVGGRIIADDLVGEPDLLVRRDRGYIAADIKSGRGDDGGCEDASGKLKPHYAVQVALYTHILERLSLSAGRLAEIWDIDGRRVEYDLTLRRGPRTPGTWWDLYETTLNAVREIHATPGATRGALATVCGLCHWRDVCSAELRALDDLTLVPALGRSARDTICASFPTMAALAGYDPQHAGDVRFSGIGSDRLATFAARARLLKDPNGTAYLKGPLDLPKASEEIFFDIEADPLRDVTYLHGFVHRTNGDDEGERFVAFTAEQPTAEAEREAFAGAVPHLASHPDAVVYYYSKYERTMYRKLQERYPEVCGADDIEAIFLAPRSIDLYFDVVTKLTEWPTNNHSIKTLAKSLGFLWRDTDPSGAASIEWYNRWVEDGDRAVLQRILDYNEDDCRATRVLLDGISKLRVLE